MWTYLGIGLGRGHTNYDIQFIVVILKVTKIFSPTTLDYWKKNHDSFGVTHALYELPGYYVFSFSGADLIVNNDNIGLRNIYHDSFVVMCFQPSLLQKFSEKK